MKIITTLSIVLVFVNLASADWQVLNSPTQNTLWSVCFADTNDGWAVGENGTIIHTTDAGVTWEFQTSSTNDVLYGVFFIDSSNGWIVGDNGIILHTSNAGLNWENQSGIVSNRLWKVFFINSNSGWAVGSSIIHTTDGGLNWNMQSVSITEALYGVSFVDEFNGWAVGGGTNYQCIIHTTNGGADWTVQSNETGSWLYSVSFIDEFNGWISGQYGTILHTTDAGNTWLNQNSGFNSDLESIFFTDNYNGWTSGSGGTILHTTDAGNSWNNQDSNTNLPLYYIFFTDAFHGWAVGYNGVILKSPDIIPVELISFTSTQFGDEIILRWQTATETNNYGFEIEKFQKKWEIIGFVSGFGTTSESHIYTYTDENIISGNIFYRLKQIDYNGAYEYSDVIELEIQAAIEYSLMQNNPNPFNPLTSITYSIPRSNFIKLIVYDILGNKIRTLVNEIKPAGNYEVEFDAVGLATGIYFYSLQAEDFIEIKKMILLR